MSKRWLMALVVIFLVIVGLHLSLSLGLLSEPLKRWTQAALARHIQWPIHIGRVNLDPVRATLILSDVKVPHAQSDQEPLLEIKEVRVSFSPWSLLREVTVIKKIKLSEPRIFLKRDDQGPGQPRWLPPFLQTQPVSGKASRKARGLVIREIEIQQGTLKARQPKGDLQIELTGMEGKALPDLRMENFQVLLISGETIMEIQGETFQFDRAKANIFIHPNLLEVRSAEFEGSEIRLAIHGNLENLNDPRYALVVDAAFPLSKLQGFFRFEQKFEGLVSVRGEVAGRWPAVSIGGDLAISDLLLDDITIGQVKTAFEYKDRSLRLFDFSSSILGGEAQGQATVDLSGSSFPYQLSLTFAKLSAGRLSELIGWRDMLSNQILDGQLEWSGQGLIRDSLSGKGKLRLYPKSESPAPESFPEDLKEWIGYLKEVTVVFELDRGVLDLKEASVRSLESLANLHGRVGLHNELELGFHLTSEKVQEFTPLLKMGFLRGSLDLKGALRGTPKDPEFQGDGFMQQAQIRGRPFERISSRLFYRHPQLVFTSAHFIEKQARYELNGSVSFDSSLPGRPFFDLKAKISQGLPREVVAIFYRELPMTSAVTGDLEAKGYPKEFLLTAGLTVGPGNLYGQEVDSGQLDLTVTHQKVSFEKVEAKYRDSVVSGEGWIEYDGHFKAALSSSQSHLQDISWGQKPLHEISATLSGKLQGGGPLRHPEFDAQILLKDIKYRDQPFGDGTLNGTIANDVLSFEASLDDSITGKGTLTLGAPFPFQMDLTLNRFQARPILDLLNSPHVVKVSAEATGTLTVRGSLKDLAQASLIVNLHEVTFDFGGYALSNEEDIDLELASQVVKIKALRLKGEGTSLAITGGLELFKNYRLFVNGEADLDLLRAVSEEITYGRGKAYLNLQVLDQWQNPEIRGGLTIQNGALKSQTLDQAITIKSLGLSFNERQILLESLEGEVGGGKLTASGKGDLAGFAISDFGVNLELTAVRISNVQGLSGSMDASLFFHGNDKSKSLKGEVLIRRASYDRRLDWQGWVVDFLKRERQAPQAIPVIGDVSLDVQVRGKENIRINNNLAKLPLEIDLLIKGSLNHPVLLGRIEAKGGVIFFRRNDFKVISGTVDFIDPDRIRPVFDIKATTRVRTYQIDLSLAGPLDRFDLSLSSDPPLRDQTEILALLTFGKTPEEVAEASKEIGASEAYEVLTGEIQEVVEEKVEAITGIDRIQVDPYYSSTKSAGTPRVTVSKRLWEDRFYVTYATTLDPSGEEVIQLEYILSNNISLVGGRDELGRVGGDLKFRFEFR